LRPEESSNLGSGGICLIYAHQRINLDRSMLADWVGNAAWHLHPPHERLLVRLRALLRLFAFDTTAPVLDPGRGLIKTGQLWVYAADDRPWVGRRISSKLPLSKRPTANGHRPSLSTATKAKSSSEILLTRW
jgi:Transposase IS66 family